MRSPEKMILAQILNGSGCRVTSWGDAANGSGLSGENLLEKEMETHIRV